MKKMTILSFFCVAFFCQQGLTQSWEKAIGLRLGYPTSVTYKQFISENGAIEAIVGTRGFSGWRTFNIAAAYQVHNTLLEDSFGGLRWYYGAGVGLTTYRFKDNFLGTEGGSNIVIQGYLGVDYTFKDAPVNISLDWVPNFLLNGFRNGFRGDSGSLAIRYIF